MSQHTRRTLWAFAGQRPQLTTPRLLQKARNDPRVTRRIDVPCATAPRKLGNCTPQCAFPRDPGPIPQFPDGDLRLRQACRSRAGLSEAWLPFVVRPDQRKETAAGNIDLMTVQTDRTTETIRTTRLHTNILAGDHSSAISAPDAGTSAPRPQNTCSYCRPTCGWPHEMEPADSWRSSRPHAEALSVT